MALKWHNVKSGDLPATEGTYYCYWPHPDGSPYYANLYFDGVKFQDGLVMMWRERLIGALFEPGENGKSAIRAVFWKRFKYNGKDYFVEIVNDSGIGKNFIVYTNYADSSKSGKLITGVPIFQKP